MHTIGTPLMWVAFTILVLVALAVDLLMMRSKGPHKVETREALLWSAGWIVLALIFNAGLWWYLHDKIGPDEAKHVALQFFTGYLVEKALAVDNIFVFLMLFGYFAVPPIQQQRVLIYGIIGAIVLRAILIFVGAALIQQFHWVLYIFGAFLVFTGVKMLWSAGEEPDIGSNPLLNWIRKRFPITSDYHGTRFTIRENGTRWFTPLFVVVVMIGITDVIFAVDSIPAIFAITDDPFIVLTSNVFAVLGLRALFFLLAGMADKFHLLVYGLATVLIFIGAKMLIADVWHIPIGAALGVVALAIGISMVASVLIPPKGGENNT
ncbi:TerC family protein [Xanthomonadaceae bacterium JHOS43]|nr:TerC family protein [Xanthomonadaceae bacterium JHOS43]MCX7562245.1 TerC family protein [Xanthomonadaceae bacterium XH05]